MKALFIHIIFITLLFSCKKQDDINPSKQTLSFIVQIDEQASQALDCRKLCYFADNDKSKVDTLKFCNVGLNTFRVTIQANTSIEFFMSGKSNLIATKITKLNGLTQLNLKHVSASVYSAEIAHVKSIY
jgi:hypothetical protein